MQHSIIYKLYPQVAAISEDRYFAEDGTEIFITPAELLRKTFESEEVEVVRAQRDALLAKTDWWAVQDRTMSQAEKDYRQALRDIPQQTGFPTSVVWPTKPE